MYIVLIENKHDYSDKHFFKTPSIGKAKERAQEYLCKPDGDKWSVEIYEVNINNLRYEKY